MEPQEIINKILGDIPDKILLGFDIRKFVTQCVELGYIAGCERSAIVVDIYDSEYEYATDIRNDCNKVLGIK